MRWVGWVVVLASCGPTVGVPADSGTDSGGGSSADSPDPSPPGPLTEAPSGTSVGSTGESEASTGLPDDLPDDLPDCTREEGELTIIACGVNTYTRFALDEAFAYFSAAQGVFRVAHAGGPASAVAGGTAEANQFLLDGPHVYWTEFDAGNIARAPREGGAREVLASGLVKPSALVVNEGRLYFTQYAEGLGLQQVPVDGGEPTTVYEIPSRGIELAPSGGYLFWGTTWNNAGGAHPLYRGTFDGAAAETRSSAATLIERIVPAPPYIYLIRYGVEGSTIRRALIDGKGSEEQLAGFPAHPWELALDDEHAYWTWTLGNNAELIGGVERIPLGGGDREPIVTDLEGPHAIELHGDDLYFTDADRLVRTPKPPG